ncbi:MAG: hypothetical protein RLZZ399_2701 [Verrucomicrobiota bacterium]|jgi:hypothetical protein
MGSDWLGLVEFGWWFRVLNLATPGAALKKVRRKGGR